VRMLSALCYVSLTDTEREGKLVRVMLSVQQFVLMTRLRVYRKGSFTVHVSFVEYFLRNVGILFSPPQIGAGPSLLVCAHFCTMVFDAPSFAPKFM